MTQFAMSDFSATTQSVLAANVVDTSNISNTVKSIIVICSPNSDIGSFSLKTSNKKEKEKKKKRKK